MKNFVKVTDNLYRSSAPTPMEVFILNKEIGITRIISLDEKSGNKIDKACKLLKINHIKLFIDFSRKSLFKFLSSIFDLLKSNEKTLIHCKLGRDRTGLAIALFKCKYMGMDPEKAIKEAKELGFGIGVSPDVVQLYERLIKSCKPSDINYSIVSNEREYVSDNRDSFLNASDPKSFAPFTPIPYKSINDQYPTRDNYNLYDVSKPIKEHNVVNLVPQVGVYDNEAGINGAGPSENLGGFIHD